MDAWTDGRKMFAIVRPFFASLSTFAQIVRGFRTCSDLFGPVRIRSDAFGCMMRSDAFGHVQKISENFVEKISLFAFLLGFCGHIRKNGRHQQFL